MIPSFKQAAFTGASQHFQYHSLDLKMIVFVQMLGLEPWSKQMGVLEEEMRRSGPGSAQMP